MRRTVKEVGVTSEKAKAITQAKLKMLKNTLSTSISEAWNPEPERQGQEKEPRFGKKRTRKFGKSRTKN